MYFSKDVEDYIISFLKLCDLARVRQTSKALKGWKYGPNITEIRLPKKIIPYLGDYYTLEHVVGFDASNLEAKKKTNTYMSAWLQVCPHLRALNLRGSFYLTTITMVQNCHLQSLNLAFCQTLDIIELVRKCPRLHTLNISNTDSRERRMNDAIMIGVVQNCPHIRTLNLSGNESITDTAVIEVARKYSHLKSLELSLCRGLTDAAVIEVARNCPHLQSLCLKHCGRNGLNDISVMEVARKCPHLQSLNLCWCEKITDAAVIEVARNCSHLQLLDLCGCANISDDAVSEVAKNCLHLQSLDLGGCWHVSDTSIINVARNCLHLQTLDLGVNGSYSRGPCNVTNLSVRKLACPHLRSLSFSLQRDKVTEPGVVKMAQQCPNLQRLYLCDSDDLTDAAVLEIVRCCPHLEEIYFNNEWHQAKNITYQDICAMRATLETRTDYTPPLYKEFSRWDCDDIWSDYGSNNSESDDFDFDDY